ncbi:MAG: lysophospholipid acyltransferase family protein [Bacilli bacterium]|nr:lysophospholipid acyltransferase family protein [Bacilli bacterium]
MKNNESIKLPNFLFWHLGYFLVKIFLKFKLRLKNENSNFRKIEGPCVILGKHQSIYDPLIMGVSSYPRRVNFVGGYSYFYNSFLRILFKLLQVIPKFQYQNDILAMKKILKVIEKGGIIGLFPTGRLPSCGVGQETTKSLTKLLIKMKVPVYFLNIEGAYLSSPKWAINKRKGEVHSSLCLLIPKEKLINENLDFLTRLINKKIYYNEYDWQKKNMIPYKGKNLAEKLENILYKCPNCESEFMTKSYNNHIQCCKCRIDLTIDDYGFFKENSFFESPLDWYSYQERKVNEEIKNNKISLKSRTKVYSPNLKTQKIELIGEGIVELSKNEKIIFIDSLDKNNLEFDLKNIESLPYRAGENFEIARNMNIYKFVLENGQEAVKWSIAVEQIYKEKTKSLS